jgi:tetratricopeptide (TPR) repeat protein
MSKSRNTIKDIIVRFLSKGVMKMKKRTMVVSLILISISHFACVNDSAQNAAEWQQDIDILTTKIEQYHPAPWARISRETFMDRAEEIKTNLQNWDREKTILEIMKLVAALKDGHTGILLANQDSFNLWFPLRIEKFHDGLFITGADIENAGLLGAKVLRMGKLDAESAYSRVGEIIAADSDHGIARLITNYLSNAVILETLGIIDSQTLLPLELLLQDGSEKKVSAESAEWRRQFNLFYYKTLVPTNNEAKTIFDDKLDTLPLYLSRFIPSRVPYWFEYIPDDRMIYFQYNNVANWNRELFEDFTERLFKTYDEHIAEIDKFIIDVRFNSGGNGYLLPPFIREFVFRRDSLTRGKLYIITGGHTFSAASNFIGQMLKNSTAITVGDIAAGPLNWCSDTITFALPNSNLMFNLSTMFWQEGHATDNKGYYPPDYYIPAAFKDYVSGSDPVMEAIKNNEAASLKDILFNEGADKFRAEFQRREKAYGPAEVWFPYTSFDFILYSIFDLNPAGKMDEALEISKLNTVLHPEDIRAWYFLADMNANKGQLKEALECYEKLLSIEPHFPEARSEYHQLLLLNTFTDQGINALASKYKDLKKSHPYQINEGTLNSLGYRLLGGNKIQDAVEIFKLNVEIHPDYANGYDSLGEAYMKAGNNELAIQNYQKSLELDPGNNNAKEMLEALRKK